ncbi:MAG TPA: hypothetical protein VLR49_05820 [Ferruginibacter sp.]|nr:hypothetical protein [Ferruginibacter sp.]
MIPLIIFIAIIAAAFFIYLNNKKENRSIDRKNRNIEKQDELIRLLKEKNKPDED